MKSASECWEKIQYEYDLHPEGWQLYMGPDVHGQTTVYALHGEYAWTIKYPKHGMNGVAEMVRIEEDKLIKEISENPLSCGLRIITHHMFQILLRQGRSEVARQVKPVSAKEADKRTNDRKVHGFMLGPVGVAHSPIAPISASQHDLERRLNEELARLTEGMYS